MYQCLGPVVYCVRSLVAAEGRQATLAAAGLLLLTKQDGTRTPGNFCHPSPRRAAAVDVLLRRARRQKEGVGGEISRALFGPGRPVCWIDRQSTYGEARSTTGTRTASFF
jgi:hypothetical protein